MLAIVTLHLSFEGGYGCIVPGGQVQSKLPVFARLYDHDELLVFRIGLLKLGFPIWNCLEPLQARNVAYCNRTPLVSAKCPEDASKLCSLREEACLAVRASTEIEVHRQWIRCPAGKPQWRGQEFHTGPRAMLMICAVDFINFYTSVWIIPRV